MKYQTHTIPFIRFALAGAFALALWAPVQTQSAEMADGKMMERCQAMNVQKQEIVADMKKQDSELTTQVAKMNNAAENKKLDLMAAIVTQMVEQRTVRHARMEGMQTAMMQHMMQHLEMGKESMSQCPMMKGMNGMDKSSADAHKEHHTEQK